LAAVVVHSRPEVAFVEVELENVNALEVADRLVSCESYGKSLVAGDAFST
jgi:hypothetical protein